MFRIRHIFLNWSDFNADLIQLLRCYTMVMAPIEPKIARILLQVGLKSHILSEKIVSFRLLFCCSKQS